MDVANAVKIAHLKVNMPKGYCVEVPFLEEVLGEIQCNNDAHVLQAMAELDVAMIPVVIHQRLTSLL